MHLTAQHQTIRRNSPGSMINLDYGGKGNYWGRSTVPYFVYNTDANQGNINDTNPYNSAGYAAACLPAGADTAYPIFSNYYDNNATLVNSGTGIFNVTVTNTNGTVILEINNTNITATNLTANVYNASYAFTTNGTYSYHWDSWGNGTSHLYNTSAIISYSVNYRMMCHPYPQIQTPPLNGACSEEL